MQKNAKKNTKKKNMSKFKTIMLYTWIALQVLILIYLWGILIYTAITSTPIETIVHWHWWIFFFVLDLWSAKFFRELPKKSE